MPSGQSGTVAHVALDRLRKHGVERVYGYPGDGINGFLGAFHESELEFVQTRHEEIAALAACAQAKLTGDVAVCIATSGPGAIHLLNGLYDAKLDHAPVVAIVGQQKSFSLGADYQQEVDLGSLFKDVASEYVQTCIHPGQIRLLIDRAVKTARVSRSVTAVIVPNDIQEAEFEPPPREHGVVYTSAERQHRARILPPEEELDRAAAVLNEGERVALLIGQGARHAADEVIEVAERLGAGVAKALNGKDALPDDLPFVTGSIGLLGTRASHEMVMGCDTLLLVGTSFPYAEWLPEPETVNVVEIDVDARRIGIRVGADVGLAGDARDTLRELLPRLTRKAERAWREEIEAGVERWWKVLAEQARVEADPLNPQLLFHELSPRLPDGCILTADSGSATNWWARHLRIRPGMRALLSGTLASMCPAVPYALAAKEAYPDRPVVATIGDGAMQMLGINALIDVAARWRRWADPRLVVLVLNNRDLNQVTWEQRVLSGDPKLDASQVIPDFAYARYAELVGLAGVRVNSPDRVNEALDAALAADRPFVLEAVTDPEVPPLPPHIMGEQARNLGEALLKGDPAAGPIVKQSLRGKLKELLTR